MYREEVCDWGKFCSNEQYRWCKLHIGYMYAGQKVGVVYLAPVWPSVGVENKCNLMLRGQKGRWSNQPDGQIFIPFHFFYCAYHHGIWVLSHDALNRVQHMSREDPSSFHSPGWKLCVNAFLWCAIYFLWKAKAKKRVHCTWDRGLGSFIIIYALSSTQITSPIWVTIPLWHRSRRGEGCFVSRTWGAFFRYPWLSR